MAEKDSPHARAGMAQVYPLLRHPAQPAPAIELSVEVSRWQADRLHLWFVVKGAVDQLLLPGLSDKPQRRDQLWQTSCFEAFLRASDDHGYMEYNFAPSGDWAAYRFDSYREGMRDFDWTAPIISTATIAGQYGLGVELAVGGRMAKADWRLGLSAVIEAADGCKSYWALNHPPGAPDFHHPDCFVLPLEAPG